LPEEKAEGIYVRNPSTYTFDGQEFSCDCEEQIALHRHYILARIPDEFMRYTETDWEGDPEAWQAVKDYLEHWDGMRVHGLGLGFHAKKMGVGKTFLATYVARKLIRRGESVTFSAFGHLVSLYELPPEERRAEEQRLKETHVLILDEVMKPYGAQLDLFAATFEEILRYRNSYGKITIYTTNLEPTAIEEYYPRAYSLLCGKQKIIKLDSSVGDVRKEAMHTIEEYLAMNNEMRPIV